MPVSRRISNVRPSFILAFGESPDRSNQAPVIMGLHPRLGGTQTAFHANVSTNPAGDNEIINTTNNGVLLAANPWIINTRLRILEIQWNIRTALALHASTANNFFLRLYRGTSSLSSIFRSAAVAVPGTSGGWTSDQWYESSVEYPGLILNPGDVITMLVRSEDGNGAYALTGTARQCSVAGTMTLEYMS